MPPLASKHAGNSIVPHQAPGYIERRECVSSAGYGASGVNPGRGFSYVPPLPRDAVEAPSLRLWHEGQGLQEKSWTIGRDGVFEALGGELVVEAGGKPPPGLNTPATFTRR